MVFVFITRLVSALRLSIKEQQRASQNFISGLKPDHSKECFIYKLARMLYGIHRHTQKWILHLHESIQLQEIINLVKSNHSKLLFSNMRGDRDCKHFLICGL